VTRLGPDEAVPVLLAQLSEKVHRDGRRVAFYGGSGRHLAAYRRPLPLTNRPSVQQ
jgi:hypothetical protein